MCENKPEESPSLERDKADYAALLAARAKSLEQLYDYTKFHIGVYLTLTTSYIAVATVKVSDRKNDGSSIRNAVTNYDLLPTDPLCLAIAVACFLLAGLAGGVIVSSITQFEGQGSKAFLDSRLGPVNQTWFRGIIWTRIEHIAFWFGLLAAIASIVIPRR